MTPKALARMPQAYRELPEEMRTGAAHITVALPGYAWEANLAGAKSTASTRSVPEDRVYFKIGPRHYQQVKWNTLQTWKRLAQMGYRPIKTLAF